MFAVFVALIAGISLVGGGGCWPYFRPIRVNRARKKMLAGSGGGGSRVNAADVGISQPAGIAGTAVHPFPLERSLAQTGESVDRLRRRFAIGVLFAFWRAGHCAREFLAAVLTGLISMGGFSDRPVFLRRHGAGIGHDGRVRLWHLGVWRTGDRLGRLMAVVLIAVNAALGGSGHRTRFRRRWTGSRAPSEQRCRVDLNSFPAIFPDRGEGHAVSVLDESDVWCR